MKETNVRLSLGSALELAAGALLVVWGVARVYSTWHAAIVAGGLLILFSLFGRRLARWGF